MSVVVSQTVPMVQPGRLRPGDMEDSVEELIRKVRLLNHVICMFVYLFIVAIRFLKLKKPIECLHKNLYYVVLRLCSYSALILYVDALYIIFNNESI